MCGAGQVCSDEDTLSLDNFNCSCLPPFNGSKIGGPASCWHDDCRDQPCGEGQECVDDDPGAGTFRCVCDNGYTATNRRAQCVYNECAERGETKQCNQCFDPADTPASVGDYNCKCQDGSTRVGSPCVGSASGLVPEEEAEEGSNITLIVIIAGAVGLLACGGAALMCMKCPKRRQHINFKEYCEGDTSKAQSLNIATQPPESRQPSLAPLESPKSPTLRAPSISPRQNSHRDYQDMTEMTIQSVSDAPLYRI